MMVSVHDSGRRSVDRVAAAGSVRAMAVLHAHHDASITGHDLQASVGGGSGRAG